MVNQATQKCPKCGYPQSEVLAFVDERKGKFIDFRCLHPGKKHNFKLEIGSAHNWHKFFKQETIDYAAGKMSQKDYEKWLKKEMEESERVQ